MQQVMLPAWDALPEIDLYMDQVVSIVERALAPFPETEGKTITPSMINNYVKQKALRPPEKKRYDRGHVAALFMICTLKRVLSMGEIRALHQLLLQNRSEEQCYALFCAELHAALAQVMDGQACAPDGPDGECGLPALRASCRALAHKLLAQELLSAPII